MAIFNNPPQGKMSRIRLRYGTANRARKTIKQLRKYPLHYQQQEAQTMYHRAKYHKYQTKGMKNAMKIYKKFLSTIKHTHS